ncbi:MAG: LLM class flavin-dependent oxidoreductase [Chloroflexota bacterium]|nr:LLM class flavin-dependent oxidoreductase [Chloroflexota bacterium]
MRPLKVGIQLPEVERAVRWPELRAMALAAEEVGLDSVWVGDHLLYRDPQLGPRGPWEAWSLLAALAAVTTRVEIGPLVACTAFHNPALLAKQAATVDDLSQGRLVLGLGAGWNRVEFDAFGIPYDHRVGRFEEAFTIVRRLLAGEEVSFDGRYHRTDVAVLLPSPLRPGRLPLMIGSIGERMLNVSLPHVQAWNAWYTWFGNSAAGYRSLRERIDAACRRVGRDPASVERSVALLVGFHDAVGRTSFERENPISALPGDDPDATAAALRELAADGVSHVQLVLDPITRESIERLSPMLQRLG